MQPGANVISLRGPESWRGMSSSSQADIGDRRWKLLQGVYVAPDGVELRKLPGWKCVYDFVGTNARALTDTSMADGAQPGFLRTFIDGWNPVTETVGDYRLAVADPTYKQLCYSTLEYPHGFKRMKGRLVLWGEMGFRREPIKNAAGTAFVVVLSWATGTNTITLNTTPLINGAHAVCTAVGGGPTSFTIQTSGTPWVVNQWTGYAFTFANPDIRGTVSSNTSDTLTVNFTGSPSVPSGAQVGQRFSVYSGSVTTGSDRPFNSVRIGSVVYIGDITGSPAGASSLANQHHLVIGINGAVLTLATTITASGSAVANVEIARVPSSHALVSAYPLAQYHADATWDKTSLGAWVSTDKPDVDTLNTECYPLCVFNRQRDYGDQPYNGREHIEGGSANFEVDQHGRGQVSRRHQKALPYRTNPDVAADKILLGAPGYGCVFQIPMSATVNPDYGGTGTALGLTGLWSNTFYDKPRSLGVPKGVMWADYFRKSDETSAHFYTTSDYRYAWGGFATFTRNKLRSYADDALSFTINGAGVVSSLTIESASSFSANHFQNTTDGFAVAGVSTGTFSSFRSPVSSSAGGVEDDYINDEGVGFFVGHGHCVASDASTGAGPFSTVVRFSAGGVISPQVSGSFTRAVTEAPDTYDAQRALVVFDRPNNYAQFTITPILAGDQMVAGEEVGNLLRVVVPADPTAGATGPFGYKTPIFEYHEIIDNGADWVKTAWFDRDVYDEGFLDSTTSTSDTIDFPPRVSIAVRDDRFGTYKFCVAYRDTATGEVGLLSEPLELTVEPNGTRYNSGAGVRLFVMHPGYLLAETGALQIELYRTKRNGNTFFFDSVVPMNQAGTSTTGTPSTKISSVFGLDAHPNHLGAIQFCVYDVPYKTDEELEEDGDKYVPTIEQMPVGAAAVKTIKGITLFGGHIGNSGDALDLIYGTCSFGMSTPNTAYAYHDQLVIFGGGSSNNTTAGYADGPWLCAQDYLPTAYAGIGAEFFIPSGFPGHSRGVEIGAVTHCSSEVDLPSMKQQHVVMGSTPLRPDSTLAAQVAKNAWLKPKTGFYNWSVQGEPGVVPATNIGFVDPDNDEDIQAIGAFAGGAVICTRSNTYYQNWIDEPRASPDLVTNEFGCLGTNTMIEYDGGTAWISDRGPVAMTGGGVSWIGRDLEAEFHGSGARYLKDSRGLMRHAFGCHDPERGLVYWGLYTEKEQALTVSYEGTTYTWAGANSDQLKSKWPCNEILAWSYKANAFSRWRLPASFGILWMERDVDADGTQRVLFLANDKRIYALDDLFNDTNKDPIRVAVSASGTGTTLTQTNSGGQWGVDQAALGASDKYLRLGMEVVLIRGSAPLYHGTITAASASSLTVTWDVVDKGSEADVNPSWLVDDVLVIGVKRAILETNWLSGTGTEKSRDNLGVQIRYLLESQFTRDWASGAGSAQIEALKVSCYSAKSPGSIDNQTFTESVVTTDQNEIGNYRSLGQSTLDTLTSFQFQKVPLRTSAPNYKVKLEFLGGNNVRLADALVEA